MERAHYGCGCEHNQYGGCSCAATSQALANKAMLASKTSFGGAILRRRSSSPLRGSESSMYMPMSLQKRESSRQADIAVKDWLGPKSKKRSSTRMTLVAPASAKRRRISPERVISALVTGKKTSSLTRTSRASTKKTSRAPLAAAQIARTRYATVADKNSTYFLRPDKMSEAEKKYCRCLADVGAKQGSACLRGVGRRGRKATGRACANPYAICGRLKPSSMGNRGCAMYYNYNTMPYAQTKATADIHNKTIQELIDAAREEAERMKWS